MEPSAKKTALDAGISVQELLKQSKGLQNILDLLPVGIAISADPECSHIAVNEAAAAILGTPVSENASKSGPGGEALPFKVLRDGRELRPDELPMQFAAAHNISLKDFEVELVREDGRVLNLFEYACPIHDEDGKVRGALGVFVDITERRRVEKQFEDIYRLTSTVAHSEDIESVFSVTLDTLESVVNAKRGSILLVDDDGVMRFKSWRGLSDKYRMSVEGHTPWLPGEHPRPVLVEDVEAEDLGALKEVIREEGIRSLAFIPLMGQRRLVGKFMVYFNEPHNFTERELNLLQTIAYHAGYAIERQLAERERARLLEREHQARTQAERANYLKDEFLAIVSHEIRTPLNAIIGWCEIIRSRQLDSASFSRAIDTILRNGHLQAQLIDDIIDVSRIITGKLELHLEPVDLTSVARAAIDSIRPAAEAKKLVVTGKLQAGSAIVSGDSQRLQQVISNVLSNAVKFSPEHASIEVQLHRDERSVSVVIIDKGQGIPAEFLPHVFDRFRQGDGSTTRKHGGLGLGLAIAKNIVELHEGTIKVESPEPGKGTRVTVQLPLAATDDASTEQQTFSMASADPAAASIDERPLAGIKILLVDDHADTLELLAAILKNEKVQVKAAMSVAAAMEALGEFDPDLLIADIAMPIEDGYGLIRKIRAFADKRRRILPAIAFTACVRAQDRRRILDAGFQRCLPKPVNVPELVSAISTLYQISRSGLRATS